MKKLNLSNVLFFFFGIFVGILILFFIKSEKSYSISEKYNAQIASLQKDKDDLIENRKKLNDKYNNLELMNNNLLSELKKDSSTLSSYKDENEQLTKKIEELKKQVSQTSCPQAPKDTKNQPKKAIKPVSTETSTKTKVMNVSLFEKIESESTKSLNLRLTKLVSQAKFYKEQCQKDQKEVSWSNEQDKNCKKFQESIEQIKLINLELKNRKSH
ncbi:hypothetical protein CF386_10545 [Paraphotobacterium marinum]|uniref:Uncharacterized protein n=1 Tax=Paraphotobacterium marinum TaxID=1755811 RepID=A0A220VGV5_9GAMM|nr:hypothetical protein [Paraphotobacterium marinum]ASK79490.1 hypothetical protein CF386_10545 [Paraphotobacterium marinum]